MKRLLAQIGITYFSVLAAAYYLSERIVMILGGIAILISVVFFFIRKIRKTVFIPAMALTAAIACIINLGYTFLVVQPVTENYSGEMHTVKAVLLEEEYKSYSKYYYRVKAEMIDGEKVNCKLLLKTRRSIDVDVDDVITFSSELQAVENTYYRSKGYYLLSDSYHTAVDIEAPSSYSWRYYAVILRQKMGRALNRFLPADCASLCKAVLLGDKYALNVETRNNFRYAGASYFVVVSGMHFSIICMMIAFLLKPLRNRWVRMTLTFAFMLLYAMVTGFQPSVLRSGIMTAITVFGITIRWQRYALNNLGFAGLLLPFIVTPYGAGDIGLILSFYATMAILLWARPIADKLCFHDEYGRILRFRFGVAVRRARARVIESVKKKKKSRKKTQKSPYPWRLFPKKLWNMIALMMSVSLAANIFVFPLSVFAFHAFSTVTLFSALLLYAEIYLILILSLLVCVFYWLGPLRMIAWLLSLPLYGLCKVVLFIVGILGALPFSYVRVRDSYLFIWMAATVLLGIVVILYRNQYRYLKTAMICSLIILLSGGIVNELIQIQMFSLEVYPCEKGICAGINRGGKLYLLRMDADSASVYQTLNKLSDRYDGAEFALCCSAKERKNYQRYSEDEFAISSILQYDDSEEVSTEENIIPFTDNSVFLLEDDIEVRVTVADGVAVPYITAGDRTILILPDKCSVDSIPEELRKADVILLHTAAAGMEKLRCDQLIVSDTSDLSRQTAYALRDCYHHVCFTDDGEVRCRLR